nr:hypothetical protein [Tanacetum cinerariifolium]
DEVDLVNSRFAPYFDLVVERLEMEDWKYLENVVKKCWVKEEVKVVEDGFVFKKKFKKSMVLSNGNSKDFLANRERPAKSSVGMVRDKEKEGTGFYLYQHVSLEKSNKNVIGLRRSTSVTKNNVSNDFSKPVTAQTLPTLKTSCLKNTNVLAPGMYKIHTDHTQARTSKLPQDSKKTNKGVSFSTGIIPTTSVSRPQLKSHPQGDRVLRSNSRGKKLEVEEHRRNVKLSKNKMSVTACTDSLNAKTVNIKYVSAMCAK